MFCAFHRGQAQPSAFQLDTQQRTLCLAMPLVYSRDARTVCNFLSLEPETLLHMQKDTSKRFFNKFGIFSGMQILGIFCENCIIFPFKFYQELFSLWKTMPLTFEHYSRHLNRYYNSDQFVFIVLFMVISNVKQIESVKNIQLNISL